ncbi:MAG: Pycsar system effector family protein [Eubacteriales bacterium]
MNEFDSQGIAELREKVLAKLAEVFANVNSWLTFAEAKNAALVALNGAGILGLIGLLTNSDYNGGRPLTLYLWICVIFLALGLIVALLSFSPFTLPFNGKKRLLINVGENINLLFYGDLVKYDLSQNYLAHIYKHYYNSDIREEDLSKIELDYGDEILTNAKITVKKYKYFKLALFFTLSAIISVVLTLLVYLCYRTCVKIKEA